MTHIFDVLSHFDGEGHDILCPANDVSYATCQCTIISATRADQDARWFSIILNLSKVYTKKALGRWLIGVAKQDKPILQGDVTWAELEGDSGP